MPVHSDGLLRRLQTDVIAIEAVALAGGPDLARPVPTCPEWTVADLLAHLGQVEDWVRRMLRNREYAEERPPDPDPIRAVADFIDGIAGYLTAMRAITPAEPCWTFGPPPQLAGFWIRRQAHEHAVHRVDLESAFGTRPAFEPEFAADGVDEFLTLFHPAHRGEPVLLKAADTDGGWLLGEGEPAAVVTADATTLYLGLWKRLDLLTDSQITGDRGVAERALRP